MQLLEKPTETTTNHSRSSKDSGEYRGKKRSSRKPKGNKTGETPAWYIKRGPKAFYELEILERAKTLGIILLVLGSLGGLIYWIMQN